MSNSVDEAAFEAALVELYPKLLKCAHRLSRNRADALDLVQDALERGMRRRGLFRTGGAPDRWMTTILRRIFLDRCRAARRLAEMHAAAAACEAESWELPPPPPPYDAFDAADLRRAVGLLEGQFREVYSLFAFEQLTHREIGRRLAMPTSTVGTRLLRARQRLREILESHEMAALPMARRQGDDAAAPPPVDIGPAPNPLPASGEREIVGAVAL